MANLFKFFLIFLYLACPLQAAVLKGSVNQQYIPDAFFGSWAVISKLISTNNYSLFNTESRDIWTISGHDRILILENPKTGAKSDIVLKDKCPDGKTLKFVREKEIKIKNTKLTYKEIVSFKLQNDSFSGSDKYIVTEFENDKIIKKNEADYHIEGVKIPE